jgi:uncharacterized RDD family membrane protein YckC
MPRWIDEWMPGAGPAGGRGTGTYPGEGLGLPADGVGSVPGFLRRFIGLTVDWLIAYAVTGVFYDTLDPLFQFVVLGLWALITVVPVALFGMSAGHTVVGIRVASVGSEAVVGFPRALLRTLLIAVVIPAIIRNEDGRGLHDRAARTVVIRSRG